MRNLKIAEYIVVVKPNKTWVDYFSITSSDGFECNHKYINKIRESKTIEVLHPNKPEDDIYSFEILKKNDILFVHNINQTGYFKRTDATNVLFFFDENEVDKDIFSIVYGNDNYQLYERLKPEFWSSSFINKSNKEQSKPFENSIMAKRFYLSTKDKSCDRRKIVELIDLENTNEQNYSIAGWLNPIILKVKLSGEEIDQKIEKNNNDTSIQQILSYLFEEESIIFVEPILSEEFETRVEFYENLWKNIQIRDSKINKTLLEYLIISEKYTLNSKILIKAWKPFLVLDSLKDGIFLIEGFGYNVKLFWIYNTFGYKKLTNNTKFFISYWNKYWNGEVEYLSFEKTKIQENKQYVLNFLSSDKNHYEVLPHPIYEKKGNDLNDFLNVKYRTPSSSILIEIEKNIFRTNEKNKQFSEIITHKCIDLITTPFKGATTFVKYLQLDANYFDDNKNVTNRSLPTKSIEFKFSWWKFWLEAIYNNSYDVDIHLWPKDYFIIGSGKLDKTPIGKGNKIYKQTPFFGF